MGRKSELLTVLTLIILSTWARADESPFQQGGIQSWGSAIPTSTPWQPNQTPTPYPYVPASPDATSAVPSNQFLPQQIVPPQSASVGTASGSPGLFQAPPPPQSASVGTASGSPGLFQAPPPPQSASVGIASGSPGLFQAPPPPGEHPTLNRVGPIPGGSDTRGFGTNSNAFSPRGWQGSIPQASLPTPAGYGQTWWGAAATDPRTAQAVNSVNNQQTYSGAAELIPTPPLPLPNGENPAWTGDGPIAGGVAGIDGGDVYDDIWDPYGGEQFMDSMVPWLGPGPRRFAARFGWWGVSSDGALAKVGEYQSVRAAPFVDLDGLWTDGLRTIDFSETLLGAEESQVGLRYFGPRFSTRVFWQEFPHRLLRDPLTGFTPFDEQPTVLPPAPENFRVMKEELDVGEDYAIRVQQLDGGFQGKLTNHINWRLNVWAMRKEGDRQVTAMAHCYTAPNATDSNGNPVTGNSCHVVSQGQSIDWVTAEIEPVVEAKFGRATVEYARTMRIFSQKDELTTRPYNFFGFGDDVPYAVVPENYTGIDKLKIGLDLPDRSDAYVYLYNGNTENKFRDTNRRFHGFDVQVTDRSFDGVSFTSYAKQYVQTGQLPTILLPEETADSIRTPITYDRRAAGVKGRWRPFRDRSSWKSGLSLIGGYEYLRLDRENALFTENVLSVDQATTIANSIRLRANMRWSRRFDSFVRYRLAFIEDPLFGVPTRNTATNTRLPTQEHLLEIGNTWTPVDTFLVSSTVGVNNSWNSSDVADFQESSYPMTFTAWYAPTPRWSISGGLAFFSNWIDQDITLGSKSSPITLRGNYGGQSDVVNLGTTFAKTERLTLSASYEYVRGENGFESPGFGGFYDDIAPLSNVRNELNRFTTGVDYRLRPLMDCYLRYQYFDYDDKATNFTSGTANWFLGGVSAAF